MTDTYEAYNKSPQQIRDLVDSGIIGDLIENVLADSPKAELKPKVIIAATSYIVSQISADELRSILDSLNLDNELASLLVEKIKAVLNSKLREISESIESTSREIDIIEQKLSTSVNQTTGETILPAQNTISETVYTSTQSAILAEGLQNPPR